METGERKAEVGLERLKPQGFVGAAVAAALVGLSAPASGAFFQIAENSASGIGNAFAGGAAAAEDASAVWYNPAGMTRLKDAQFLAGGHYIHPSFKASEVSARVPALNQSISGGGGDAGEAALVPNIYASFPVSQRFAIGAGVNAPFGLATSYDETWAGRYYALRSDIKSVNLNLAGAFKFHDALSLGVGVNRQHLEAELTQAVDFATLCTAVVFLIPNTCGVSGGFGHPNSPNDGKAKVSAKGDTWGYNAGVLSQFGDTRIGLAYRSKMKYKLDGTFDITEGVNVPAALLTNPNFRLVDSAASAEVTLPATASLSVYQNLGSAWAIMADFTRTYWSVLPELRIKFDSGQADQVVTLNLKDVSRYSLGATYKPNASWTLRTGAALDKSPVSDPTNATPRLPDSDRRWLSLGAGLQASKKLNFDFAYTHIKLAGSTVTKTDGGLGTENQFKGDLTAKYTGSVQIFSAQARWAF